MYASTCILRNTLFLLVFSVCSQRFCMVIRWDLCFVCFFSFSSRNVFANFAKKSRNRFANPFRLFARFIIYFANSSVRELIREYQFANNCKYLRTSLRTLSENHNYHIDIIIILANYWQIRGLSWPKLFANSSRTVRESIPLFAHISPTSSFVQQTK